MTLCHLSIEKLLRFKFDPNKEEGKFELLGISIDEESGTVTRYYSVDGSEAVVFGPKSEFGDDFEQKDIEILQAMMFKGMFDDDGEQVVSYKN